ncbi:riboflavin synthase [Eubacterium ramulus]|jgi:riboflavin synthase|uniref:riboflavin synthase n=1 Tax=Eubacterium ramulus TaxID=39490 RepID=UPI0026EFA86E|nr:riboflavin synthase [Eubacterium ramulus]
MFTGLIEEVGTIQNVRRGARSCVLTIGCKKVLEGSQIGDSIAVNGVCLTVTNMGGSYYTADVMAETMNRSSLRQLSTGASVNLERAMPANGRFGGHIVSGHIDGTGTVQSIEPDDNAIWYTIAAKPNLLRYIVEKGSITIDGISLTVAYVDEHCFKVSIIPHTQQVTALHDRGVGDIVNLECDIIGKYVEKLLQPAAAEEETKKEIGITEDFLKKYGF